MLDKLGKYKLVEVVGRGAMGKVYKAIDPVLGRPVALKTITRTSIGDAELLERFYREARSAGALEHPNIVTIYELGQDGNTPFIAMEYLEGESLEKLIERREPLSLLEKVGLVVPVCRALDYAHKLGVVHRDIKPGNVMFTKDGKVKVVDFGIARQMNASMTQTNMFIGTLSYMSPQLIYGERADERSDIWALGVTFYELLCYERPFQGDNHAALMLSIAEEGFKPRPVREVIGNCPAALEAVVARMLEKDVRQRFPTMAEVLMEIEPVWENLQQASLSGLIAESETLIQRRELSRARDLLRKALQIDSRNSRARALFEQVSTEIRHVEISAQTASLLEAARKLQQDGQYREAQAQAEAALKLEPSSGEARELLVESQRQSERKRAIDEGIQSARQHLAEGALTEAMEGIQKVLALDGNSTQGRVLKKQIQDQILWRQEQKRIGEVVQRARKLWADQRFEDCIAILDEAQKEFPRDPEIARLLETSKLDHVEQQKLKGLTEARGLLAAQRFEAALARVRALLKRFPGDPAAQKLQDLIRNEKEEALRREKRDSEIAALRSLVNTGQFAEAAAQGEKVLKEFSEDAELSDLVRFARAEHAQLEQKRKHEEALQSILKKIEAEQSKGAVAAAERALLRFPGDPAVSSALQQARERLKAKESRELLQQRVGEIRARINKGQHTDAVDLARQTLSTLGPDEQTTHLLRLAEVELEQKREKQEEQEKQLTAVRSVVQEGRFADATQILKGALEMQLLSRKDPRVQDLLKKIKIGKAAAVPVAANPVPTRQLIEEPVAAAPSSVEPQAQTVPVQEVSAESVHAVAGEILPEALSATVVSTPQSSTEPVAAFHSSDSESSSLEESLFVLDSTAMPEATVVPALLSRVIQTIHERPLPFGLGFLIFLTAAAGLFLYVSNRPTPEDSNLRTQAREREEQRDWPGALADYEILARNGRALASVAQENASRLQQLIDQENSLLANARDRESKGDSGGAKDFYGQVAALHGDKEQLALDAIARLTPPVETSASARTTEQHPSRGSASSSDKAQTTSKVMPKTAGESCQLIPSDVIRHLERADRDRGNGKYDDAERLYNDVLACAPNNERARSGLDRTRKARAAERNLRLSK